MRQFSLTMNIIFCPSKIDVFSYKIGCFIILDDKIEKLAQ